MPRRKETRKYTCAAADGRPSLETDRSSQFNRRLSNRGSLTPIPTVLPPCIAAMPIIRAMAALIFCRPPGLQGIHIRPDIVASDHVANAPLEYRIAVMHDALRAPQTARTERPPSIMLLRSQLVMFAVPVGSVSHCAVGGSGTLWPRRGKKQDARPGMSIDVYQRAA
jgi:hypothetical protein